MIQISGNLVDIINERIYPATLTIKNGMIVQIAPFEGKASQYIIPGFVDAHIHTESSMLPPSEFARLAVLHGTVATVSDPHEIGNVLGVAGVEYMLENASTVPLKFNFGAPSCVPATAFETSGATIGPKEIQFLLSKPGIKYLSEVMNYPGVIQGDPIVLAKLKAAKLAHKHIDGHAPGVTGEDLKKYIAANIETDHECSTYKEAKEKCDLGMKIIIREGSAARNFEALFPLMLEAPDRCMLCCDDLHPDSLLKGHINLLVKRAVEKGMDVMKALRCASLNTVTHYGLNVGLLRKGDAADFLLIDNLKDFNVLQTYIDGVCVAKEGKALFPRTIPKCLNNFNASKKEIEDFAVSANPGRIKVIEAIEGQLVTRQLEVEPLIVDGHVVSDPAHDILKITVVNRYVDAPPAVAFIKNFGFKKGAIASSVAHDSHNIIAVGVSDEAIGKAVNCLIENKGGIAVVDDQVDFLSLPIGGLMSDQDGYQVAEAYERLDGLAKTLGCTLKAPFMTLSFMALLVIPTLKISDKGLFDGKSFTFTSLFT